MKTHKHSLAMAVLLAASSVAAFGAQGNPTPRRNQPGEVLTPPPPAPPRRTPPWLRGRGWMSQADRDALEAAEQKRLRRQARNLLNRSAGGFR